METAFDVLNKVHGDLLEAAARERATLRPVPGRGPRRVSSGLVAAAVAVLVSAGLIGLLVRSDGLRREAASEAGSTGGTGAVAETGATGAIPSRVPRRNSAIPTATSVVITPSRNQISSFTPADAEAIAEEPSEPSQEETRTAPSAKTAALTRNQLLRSQRVTG